jgi:tyrosine-specific transport protein
MAHPKYLVAALPLFFTSFGFQATVPSIVRYLEGDIKRIRLAIFWGAGLPLLAYLLWTAVTNGVIANESLVLLSQEQEPVSALVFSLSEGADSVRVTMSITLFTALALITSFLGVALGLFDHMAEAMKYADSVKGRVRTAIITFLPPLIAVLLVPGAFVAALGFAAVALVVLALLLPGVMVWKLYIDVFRPWQRMLLGLAMAMGVVIVVAQFLVAVGVMPRVG